MRKASFAAEQASPIEHISRSVVDGVLNDASGLSCWPRPGVPVSCLLHFDLYLYPCCTSIWDIVKHLYISVLASPAMSSSHPQPLPSTTHASPIPSATAPSSGHNWNPDSVGTPPIPPPRTSSTQRGHHHSERSNGSRHAKTRTDERRDRSDKEQGVNGREGTMDDSRGTSSRHRGAQPSDASTPATQPTVEKESSTILDRTVITDPAVDVAREKERQLEATTASGITPVTGLGLVGSEGVDDGGRGGHRSRHDYSSNSSKRRETSFGQYILGQTLGEGEFGKVKLGWKKDGSIQVAIKLIRRESLGSNPSRLPKIYREISILRDLSHPNIVRLHEMVETDRHIGIIMEYASGGELFDHILNNRYLKDNAARRLFAQLVSGVGYLHKKGIVHRDLKLENLLLDRNRNIIITDFGFANTFNPTDELGEEIEYNLTNREFVKRMRLDKVDANGLRRGDLMQTSCGSPCYAAPELVVSDSLYTGRKVDVWSCGVILYAMLAGYLPFDDDPANPEGDNINLLYKYIVTTPLTFPEYVTPHARDLLRRILVPDPRKRADLFEVARHSWLSEYSHIVSHITSNTTNVSDIANTTVPAEDAAIEAPALTRSASVREPPKSHQAALPTVGGLNHQQGKISPDQPAERSKTQRDAKRRTVQVEYVAPQSQTARGESSATGASANASRPSRASGTRGYANQTAPTSSSQDMPPSQNVAAESAARGDYSKTSAVNQGAPDIPRSMSDSAGTFIGHHAAAPQNARPTTGGSMNSINAGRLPSRGSYGQPVAPTVAATNAQGRLAQPKNGKQYVISSPIPQQPGHASTMSIGRPSAQELPAKFSGALEPPKGHKRSNTVTGIGEKLFGRSGTLFSGRTSQAGVPRSRTGKRYPPTSMKEPFSTDSSRVSTDSRRSLSYALGRKQSEGNQEPRPRRFSLLPASFSLKGFGSGSRSQTPEGEPQMTQVQDHVQDLTQSVDSYGQHRPSTGPTNDGQREPSYGTHESTRIQEGPSDDISAQIDQHFATLHGQESPYPYDSYPSPSADHVYENSFQQPYSNQPSPFQEAYNSNYSDLSRPSMQAGRSGKGSVLLKNNRKFADAYEYERDLSHHSGSSGAARKVMDFFRRRGKARVGDDR
ncbi:hypothetical protein DTO195F2_4413 [Paecilomyces variotii]|nr:hypothetical protein DTO195F2_4413 [Paecilomyces variotii]KAJ9350251.1 hypothetical protein DTO027B9_7110 [Paecilomyces variotii]KAJ9368878.1 hypothetical protein DTO282E5_6478 [Paecilomyces variotii]KAJ9396645.1 hypothetical protein DTO282F9_6465 [Paecilomyces variotii]